MGNILDCVPLLNNYVRQIFCRKMGGSLKKEVKTIQNSAITFICIHIS